MTPEPPHAIEYSSDVGRFADDLLRLQASASQPYATFVYDDVNQADRITRLVFDKGVAEFSPPACELLVERGLAIGLLVALDHTSLRKRRLASAVELVRSGTLDEFPAVARRLRLASSTLLRPVIGDWYLSRIAVSESARGCGYGRQLVDRFLHAGRERGLTRAVLEVDPASVAAIRLYEDAGFLAIDEHAITDPESDRVLTYRHMAATL